MKKCLLVFIILAALLMVSGMVFADLNVGDEFTFGRIEQDDDPDNGPEPIEWRVLDTDDGRALVISKYGLESHWYNSVKTEVTWAESTLRKWLNEDFYTGAFDAEERTHILQTQITTAGDLEKGTDGGADTSDYLFVLSAEDARNYFGSNEDRSVEATAYEKKHGAFVRPSNGKSEWWLRDPGRTNQYAATVDSSGAVYTAGNSVNNVSTMVRPVFWIESRAVNASSSPVQTSEPVLLSGFMDLDALAVRKEKNLPPRIISLAEAEALGLKIPEVPEGKELYLGEGSTDQVEKFVIVFTMDPDTQAVSNIAILIYQADFESAGIRAEGLTVSVSTDGTYTVSDGRIDGGNFSFEDFKLTDWGAETLFSYTLILSQPVGFEFTFDEAQMTFVKQDAPEKPVPSPAPEADLPAGEEEETITINAGEHIFFGYYEQDDKLSNGPEPVEWRVLAVQNGQVLLVSEYGLDGKRFHTDPAGAKWEDSSLRKWLTGEFADSIFSDEERALIAGEGDILSLLTMEEATTLFASDKDRICTSTVFAAEHGANSRWWLKSQQERSERQAMDVDGTGKVSVGGNTILAKQLIRPVLRLDPAGYQKALEISSAGEPLPEAAAEPSALPVEIPEEIRVGNVITFGRYEQDNDKENGPEPVEWQILAVENGSALLISKYGLDEKAFHNKTVNSMTWHECSLRDWMNGEFYNSMFNNSERQQIVQDEDSLFLLTSAEAKALFDSDEARACTPTAYAAGNGDSSWWWLRTQSYMNDNSAAAVKTDGEVSDSGNNVIHKSMIRPAFRLDLAAYAEAAAYRVELPESVEEGDIITFGRYEQDGDPDNGTEPVEWLVLAAERDHALVISSMILDAKPYELSKKSVTWEKSSLRSWLNGEFYDNAFSDEEKEYILKNRIDNPDNPVFGTDGGEDTRDRLFLLSMEEAETYFSEDQERAAFATPQAEENGAFADITSGRSWWWLRTPGRSSSDAVEVGVAGWILERGTFIDNAFVGVRPALWLDLSGGAEEEAAVDDAPEDDASSGINYGVISVTGDVGVLVRLHPSVSADIIRSISNGTRVRMTDETRNSEGRDWVKILTPEGWEGWIPSSAVAPK